MPRVLTKDLRERVVGAVEAGMSCRAAAVRFGFSAASAIRWRQLALKNGAPAAKPQGGDRRSVRIKDHADLICAVIERRQNVALEGLRAVRAAHGVSASVSTLWRFFARHWITRRVRPFTRARDRPDILKQRWTGFEAQRDLDPDRLVFIDKTWASTNMARRHGRCRRGERLRASVPHDRWKTTIFVAGLRRSGMVASWVLDGPINREAFCAYVGKVLVPEFEPGAVAVMNNLSSHKAPAVREMIEAAGASLLYLPPYSPDVNPIEQAFSKLKPHLCEPAVRTIRGLLDAIGRIVDLFKSADCANHFANCGYDAT